MFKASLYAVGSAALFATGSASAAVIYGTGVGATTTNEVFSTAELAYVADVSSTDLINGLTPVDDGRWFTTAGRSPAKMTDGVHGGASDVASLAQPQSPPAVLVFDMGTGDNGLGFDLDSIISIASWRDSAFGNQVWTLEVAGVGDDGSLTSTDFETLVSVDYQPLSGGAGGSSKVTLDGLSGDLTSGVQYLRLTGLPNPASNNNRRFAWREFDITGASTAPSTTIPEPTSLIIGAAGLGLCALRRRRSN